MSNEERIKKDLADKAAAALELLQRIEDEVESISKTDNPNWGHVGSMGHVVDELCALKKFICNEEY